MTNRAQKLSAIALIVLIILVVLGGFAYRRGVITMDGWMPSFHLAALTASQPSLDRDIKFHESMPEDVRTLYEQKVIDAKASLEANPANEEAWRNLAIYYKMGSDYDGAVEIWKYLIAKNPIDGISLHNLGEHYFHNEKKYEKAEDYYRQSIEVMPLLAANYTDLHEMYKYVYKQDTSNAVDVLKEGATAAEVHDAVNMLMTLGFFQKEKGDIAGARESFTLARDNAKGFGNPSLVKTIEAELAALK